MNRGRWLGPEQRFGTENQVSVIALLDGKRAVHFPINNERILPPQTIASELPGFISRGINRLHFARDINADGLTDLVIPGAGEIHLLIMRAERISRPLSAFFRNPSAHAAQYQPLQSLSRTGGTYTQFNLRDVNADSREDLVVRTDGV